MNNGQLGSIPPRLLKFRHQYRIYFRFMVTMAICLFCVWSSLIYKEGFEGVWANYPYEFMASVSYFIVFLASYFTWWRLRLHQTIQVFDKGLIISRRGQKINVSYADVNSIRIVGWSLFYLYMKNGDKHYFNSTLERVDYIWEGIYLGRPDLISKEEYDAYRIKLVQYDHHQKRKEWFFKHRMVDIVNWCLIPISFMLLIFWTQTKEVVIHQEFYYFFRLTMYALLTLLTTAFLYNLAMKKLVFDKKVEGQLDQSPNDKFRDLEYENVVIQRSKIAQSASLLILFGLIIQTDFNMYTLTKIRGDFAAFELEEGKTLVVDNRYNCQNCKYEVKDGDMVVYSKGQIGQVLARAGELVAQVSESKGGRNIASESVTLIPEGHIAIGLSDGNNIKIIKESELVGKLQN